MKKIGKVNYEVSKPNRPRKTQVCHVNLLKPYFQDVANSSDQESPPTGEGEESFGYVLEGESGVSGEGDHVDLSGRSPSLKHLELVERDEKTVKAVSRG